jgi:hypothetical protein
VVHRVFAGLWVSPCHGIPGTSRDGIPRNNTQLGEVTRYDSGMSGVWKRAELESERFRG